MTRKDYVLLAEALYPYTVDIPCRENGITATTMVMQATARWVMVRIADRLAEDNPRFDRDKFYAACGVTNRED